MKSDEWRPKSRSERTYADLLSKVWEQFGEVPGVAARTIGSAEFLWRYAVQAATRMITGLYFEGAKTWREAARESGKTDVIYRALQAEMRGPVGERVRELIRENAKLISSFPPSVARQVAAAAAAQQQAGGRAKEFRGWLTGVVRSRAQLIARTEISKASTALTEVRSESLGLDWYVWMTSEDQRVRLSHRKMQNVLVRFDSPPSPEALIGMPRAPQPYNAGNIYNCRCYPAPVVRPENLSWPHRAYFNGRVQYMTLSQFRIANQTRRAA